MIHINIICNGNRMRQTKPGPRRPHGTEPTRLSTAEQTHNDRQRELLVQMLPQPNASEHTTVDCAPPKAARRSLALSRVEAAELADDLQHHLVGATANREEAVVAVETRDGRLCHEAHAAPVLQAAVRHLPPARMALERDDELVRRRGSRKYGRLRPRDAQRRPRAVDGQQRAASPRACRRGWAREGVPGARGGPS